MKTLLIYFVGMLISSAAEMLIVGEPVADFLTLPIEDRYSDASEIVCVYKVMIDLDLDGQPEVLVGHHKMWLGDNDGIYFAVYRVTSSGKYERLTEPKQDIRLMFRDGLPKYNFVGRVDEIGASGLLIFNPPHGDAVLSAQRIESRQFLSISEGTLKILELPGLDLSNQSEQAFFEKYSEQAGKQGGFSCESLTSEKLKQLGYSLPDWTKLPVSINSSVFDTQQTSSDHSLNPQKPNSVNLGASNENKQGHVTLDQTDQSLNLWPWIVGVIALIFVALVIIKRRSR